MPTGEGEGYKWSQTKEDVEIVVTVPEGTRAKSLDVVIKSKVCVQRHAVCGLLCCAKWCRWAALECHEVWGVHCRVRFRSHA